MLRSDDPLNLSVSLSLAAPKNPAHKKEAFPLNHLLSFFRRLYVLFVCPGAAHYVAGAPSLPPPLTPEQEKALLARMMAGDRAARDDLITHNLRLVVYLAKKYENTGVPAEDMISIGTIG